jgi:hypothetical protein
MGGMKHILPTLLSFLLLASAPAWAGKRISMESTDLTTNTTTARETLIDTNRLRVNDGDTSILFLTQGGDRMVILTKSRNEYQEIDKAMMDQMAGPMAEMAKMMQGMPPEQRAMMEQMMKGKMGAATPAAVAPPIYTAKGAATVNGFRCTNYDETEGGQKTAEICAAARADLLLNTSDFQVFERMRAFTQAMAGPMAQMMPRTSGPRTGLNGFPVQTVEFAGGKATSREQVKSIADVTLTDADFSTGTAKKVEMGGPGPGAAKGKVKGK